MNESERRDLASRIDHAVLAPSSSADDVARAAGQCARLGVRGLCVTPRRAHEAARRLAGTPVRLVVVVGFPAAASRAEVTRREAAEAIADGAHEIDAVVPWGALRDGAHAEVGLELAAIVAAVRPAPVKAIIEASEFDDDALARIASEVVARSGASYLKTGTGVYGRPLQPDRIRRIRHRLPEGLLLKVSGGIHDLGAARAALEAGADLLGMSRSFAILGSQDGTS